jgi:hypothetical protein
MGRGIMNAPRMRRRQPALRGPSVQPRNYYFGGPVNPNRPPKPTPQHLWDDATQRWYLPAAPTQPPAQNLTNVSQEPGVVMPNLFAGNAAAVPEFTPGIGFATPAATAAGGVPSYVPGVGFSPGEAATPTESFMPNLFLSEPDGVRSMTFPTPARVGEPSVAMDVVAEPAVAEPTVPAVAETNEAANYSCAGTGGTLEQRGGAWVCVIKTGVGERTVPAKNLATGSYPDSSTLILDDSNNVIGSTQTPPPAEETFTLGGPGSPGTISSSIDLTLPSEAVAAVEEAVTATEAAELARDETGATVTEPSSQDGPYCPEGTLEQRGGAWVCVIQEDYGVERVEPAKGHSLPEGFEYVYGPDGSITGTTTPAHTVPGQGQVDTATEAARVEGLRKNCEENADGTKTGSTLIRDAAGIYQCVLPSGDPVGTGIGDGTGTGGTTGGDTTGGGTTDPDTGTVGVMGPDTDIVTSAPLAGASIPLADGDTTDYFDADGPEIVDSTPPLATTYTPSSYVPNLPTSSLPSSLPSSVSDIARLSDAGVLANQGLPAPIRDINIPETLYPWGNYTDEQRQQGYVLPVYTPQLQGRMPGEQYSDTPEAMRFGPGGGPAGDTIVQTGPDGIKTTSYTDEETGQVVVVSGYIDNDGIWNPTQNIPSETTQDDWDCGPYGEPYMNNDGDWLCAIKQEDDLGTTQGYRFTGQKARRKDVASIDVAHGGPINAGIGNLMSRQRQYAYPDGTRMVEEVSQGRFPLRRRNV